MDKIKPMFCYSNKVLPLVYDDTLSYYETLCKVVAKINEVIAYVDSQSSDYIKELIDEKFNSLMINAIYDAENETIILKEGVINRG